MRLLVLLVVVLSLPFPVRAGPADAASPASAPALVANESRPVPPTLRLPRTILPESNRVSLVLDPSRESFEGRIEIAARVSEPTRVLWLNAQDLAFEKATVTIGGVTLPLEILPQENDFVGFLAPREIPPGAAVIAISYTGKIDSTETEGIFRQKEGEDWYAFSQFEPIAARHAFPCFDEPDSKVPWQLTLEVPKGQMAVANTPAASEQDTDRGTRVVTFQETKPLPSYLVAFAVGPFDAVDAGKSRRGTPIRVVVPKGRGTDVAYVADTTTPILGLLEDYFDMPYPFTKLDLLAIPLTVGFGAMENPGLVTFNQRLLTARREDFTIGYRRSYASTTAHELAHQWFGDLVTLAWWDDLWLNEAFASWMGGKIVDRWKPDWDQGVGEVTRRSGAMAADSLQSARMIRQPIESNNDIRNAFDGITYQKGASVIRMFERWAGEERFRDGIRAYLRKNASSNATAAGFLRAVGEASGRDVASPFSTFLDRVGVPLVSFDLACEQGRAPVLHLKQQRYLPLGSQADPDQNWQVPVCVRYSAGGGQGSECVLLTEPTGKLELPHATACPAWVLPNDGGLGYYRSELHGDLLKQLLERGMQEISLPERVGVFGDVNALVTAGKVDVGLALSLVTRYARDDNRHIVGATAGIAEGISDAVPDDLRPNYARFVRAMFEARARQLGWTPAQGEDDDTRLLRNRVLALVADKGEDRELAAAARELALGWMDNHASLDPDMVSLVLETAARYGDTALFERFYVEARKATDRRDRQRLLGPLSGFRDPDLARRAMGLALTDEFDIRESLRLVLGALQNPQNRRLVYEFVKQNYDALLAKMPKQSGRSFVSVAVALCDASVKPDAEAFFKDRMAQLPGGPRDYEQAMERLDLCVKQREAQRPSIVAFLEEY